MMKADFVCSSRHLQQIQTFVWDVWFDSQIVYSKIEHLSNIDEIILYRFYLNQATVNAFQKGQREAGRDV